MAKRSSTTKKKDLNPKAKSFDMEKMVEFWRANPVQAAEDIFNIKLDWHQQIVFHNRWKHDVEIDILSRGTGKTFLDGLFAATRAVLLPGHRVGLIGPSFRQSKMVFAEIEKLYERSPLFQEACVRAPARTPESCYVKLKAAPGQVGSYIEALPIGTDGGKIRGARFFDVIADEAAQIDSSILNTVVRGFLATSPDPMARVEHMKQQHELVKQGVISEQQMLRPPNNKYILSSTAFYQYNHLWERVAKLMDDLRTPYLRAQRKNEDVSKWLMKGSPLNNNQLPHRVMSDGVRCLTAFTCEDPSPGFMNVDSINQARLEMSEHEFLMEYFCYFPPDSEGFFRRSLLDAARAHGEFEPVLEPRKGCVYAAGIDPARSSDNFAISVFEVEPELRAIRLVRMLTWNKKNFPEMHMNVRRLIRHYDIKWMKMDAGGGGTTIRDLLADEHACPPGEQLVLEDKFDEHRVKTGRRTLAPLCQFSNYQWVHDANFNVLNALQGNLLKIASTPPIPGKVYTPTEIDRLEVEDKQIDETLVEMSSIITIPVGGRMRWDTPTKKMRKDRYSAVIMGFDAARELLERHSKPKSLPMGFWA